MCFSFTAEQKAQYDKALDKALDEAQNSRVDISQTGTSELFMALKDCKPGVYMWNLTNLSLQGPSSSKTLVLGAKVILIQQVAGNMCNIYQSDRDRTMISMVSTSVTTLKKKISAEEIQTVNQKTIPYIELLALMVSFPFIYHVSYCEDPGTDSALTLAQGVVPKCAFTPLFK